MREEYKKNESEAEPLDISKTEKKNLNKRLRITSETQASTFSQYTFLPPLIAELPEGGRVNRLIITGK